MREKKNKNLKPEIFIFGKSFDVDTNRIHANSLTISEAFQKKEEEGRIIKKEKKEIKKTSDYY
jgi:hypothetical protein